MLLHLQACDVDLDRHEVRRDEGHTTLTPQEAGLLRFLVSRAGKTVSREALLSEVWGWRARSATRAVDNTMMRLRSKVERDPREPDHLRTVRGHGYRYEGPQPDQPAEALSLYGRDEALSALLEATDQGGLVTIMGPGGVGKTSLALALLARRPGVFCDLSGVDDPVQAAEQVASLLGVRGADALDAVRQGLSELSTGVLVLDNYEQLAQEGWLQVQRWAEAAGRNSIVLTSRVRLRVPAERVLELAPLTPDDAVRLLRARCGLPPEGEVTPDELALVEAIDRLPLAVELISGWSDLGGPAQLLAQVRGQLTALSSRDHREPRHRSIANLIDTSWSLLSPAEAKAMELLSVFVGGFDLDAADRVLDQPALVLLGRLVDKSLIQRRRLPDGTVRFELLELVRAHAAERLATSGPERLAAELRHARWLEARLRELDGTVKEQDRGRHISLLRMEQANLRAMLERMRGRDPHLAAVAVFGRNQLTMNGVADPRSELELVQQVLPGITDPGLFLRLVQLETTWLNRMGRLEEVERRLRSVLPEAWLQAPERAAILEGKLGFALLVWGRAPEAVGLLRRTRERATPYPKARALATSYLGIALTEVSARTEAEATLREAVALLDREELIASRDYARERLVVLILDRGGLDEAQSELEDLIERSVQSQRVVNLNEQQVMLARVHLERGEHGEAERLLTEAAELEPIDGHHPTLHAYAREVLGSLRAEEGDLEQAIDHWQVAAGILEGRNRPQEALLIRARIHAARGEVDALEQIRGSLEGGRGAEVSALLDPDGAPRDSARLREAARLGRALRVGTRGSRT